MLSTNDSDTWVTGIFSYLFLGGFNNHTPHHFFPTADLSVQPKIMKIIDRICKEKGIKHFQTNRISCFISISKGIINRIPFVRK
jgi:fatty acid desaturase